MVPPDKKEVEAITALLEGAGLGAEDLLVAITTLANAKKDAQEKREAEVNTPKKNVLNKEFVYPDETAVIYQRGDVKSNQYYFRCYDKKSKKQYIKSLGTTDRVAALYKARTLFQEIQGKIQKGERVRSITSSELAKMYIASLEKIVSPIPHQGITPETLKTKKKYINTWLNYIAYIGAEKTAIDRIPREKGRDFGMWYFLLPKEQGKTNKPRSADLINNAISEVNAMYNKIAVRDRYISLDAVPQLDKLKPPKDEGYKRDILTIEQYEAFWKYMEYKYTRDKSQKPDELLKRIIFTKFQGILYNTGLRPKEALGLFWHEVQPMTGELSETHMKIKVRADNSKTGRSRVVVAPISSRIKKIRECYKEMGIELKPSDYVFMNPSSKTRTHYARQTYYARLIKVLEMSGLKDELASEGKELSLYSSRHFFITMRLRYGKVPLYLLSKAVGTSVKNITDTYGNISVEIEAETLTKNMGRLIKSGVDMGSSISAEDTDED